MTTFWESTLGPVMAAVLAGVFAAVIIPRAQRRQQEIQRQQDHERERQRRDEDRVREEAQCVADLERADRREKSELSIEMFQVAYTFFVLVEDAARARQHAEPEPTQSALDEGFAKFKSDGRVIECRLRVADDMTEIRWLWHAIMDLLTIRFFNVRHSHQRIADLIIGQPHEHAATRAKEDPYTSEAHRQVRETILARYLRDEDIANSAKVKENFAAALDQLIKVTALANRHRMERASAEVRA